MIKGIEIKSKEINIEKNQDGLTKRNRRNGNERYRLNMDWDEKFRLILKFVQLVFMF